MGTCWDNCALVARLREQQALAPLLLLPTLYYYWSWNWFDHLVREHHCLSYSWMSGLDIGIPRTPVLEGSGSFRGLLGLRGFRIPSVRGFANALAHIGITCFAYPLLVLLAWRIAKKIKILSLLQLAICLGRCLLLTDPTALRRRLICGLIGLHWSSDHGADSVGTQWGSSTCWLHRKHRITFSANARVYRSENWDTSILPSLGCLQEPAITSCSWLRSHCKVSILRSMIWDVVTICVRFCRGIWVTGCCKLPAWHMSQRPMYDCSRIAAISSWYSIWEPEGCSRCAWHVGAR